MMDETGKIEVEDGGVSFWKARQIEEKGIPPVYLRDIVAKAREEGPALMLWDGKWCGNKSPFWNVFSIFGYEKPTFLIRLPKHLESEEENIRVIPRVELAHVEKPKEWFTVYDARFHPASFFAYDKVNPKYVARMHPPFHCSECQGRLFSVALGFEIPTDCMDPNDMSWFALGGVCHSCGWKGIVYEDEITKSPE